MILIDANLLLYAVSSAAARHQAAKRWLDSTLSGTEEVGFAWSVVLAFLRISTHPGLFPRPLPTNCGREDECLACSTRGTDCRSERRALELFG